MAQAELPEPVTGAHPIQPCVLTRTDEIAQRLMLGCRDEDLRQQSSRVETREPPRVALVGLHAIPLGKYPGKYSGLRGH